MCFVDHLAFENDVIQSPLLLKFGPYQAGSIVADKAVETVDDIVTIRLIKQSLVEKGMWK